MSRECLMCSKRGSREAHALAIRGVASAEALSKINTLKSGKV